MNITFQSIGMVNKMDMFQPEQTQTLRDPSEAVDVRSIVVDPSQRVAPAAGRNLGLQLLPCE